MLTKPTHPAIFARISRDDTDTQAGVNRQIADGRALAKSLHWPNPTEYVDNNVSAWSGVDRPEYQRLLADIESGHVDGVIVYNFDRLHRQPKAFYEFLGTVHEAGIDHNVRAVTGDADLSTGEGRFFAGLQTLVAAKSSDDTSRRLRRQKADLAAAGAHNGGGRRPFGYTINRAALIDSEAAIVRTLSQRFLAGDSIRSLTTWLQDQPVTTVGGGPWRTNTVLQILTSPGIAGLREHHGEIIGTATWPAIISPEDHYRITARLKERHIAHRRAPQTYLLTGLLICGKCGHRLYSRARRQGSKVVRRYVCSSGPDFQGCGGITVVAAPLEELIAAAVLEAIDSPEVHAARQGLTRREDEGHEAMKEAAKLEEQLNELATDHGNGLITRQEWFAARAPLNARLEAATAKLRRATSTQALAGIDSHGDALRRDWAALTLSRQSAICEAVIDHITIQPATSGRIFDHRRVNITWRA